MRVGAARAAAADWVMRTGSREVGFQGAYFSGSTIAMPDDAELPRASDVDVMVVTAAAEPPMKIGKFIYRGALLFAYAAGAKAPARPSKTGCG